MKNISLFLIGGFSTILFAPIFGYILICVGTYIMLIGKALSEFPGVF